MLSPEHFRKIVGLETEHFLAFSPSPSMTDMDILHARRTLAKELVASCDHNQDVQWCYDYPHELYTFPGTVNRLLKNGSRLYDELGYVEMSSAECLDPLDLVALERANSQILAELVTAYNSNARRSDVALYRINLEYGKSLPYSVSSACHENYSVSPELFEELTAPSRASLCHWIPFLVTRIIFSGAGCMGGRIPAEVRDLNLQDEKHRKFAEELVNQFPPQLASFQISQRADFMTTLFELETMKYRPLVNLRDEPHADPTRFRRLHVIAGDSNRLDLSNYLKVGVSQIVLAMLECKFLTDDFRLMCPLQSMRIVSRDLALRSPLQMAAGGTATALVIQHKMCQQARRFLQTYAQDLPEHYERVVELWEGTLRTLQQDPQRLVGRLDWCTKLNFAEEDASIHRVDRSHALYQVVDTDFSALQYHDMDGRVELVDIPMIDRAAVEHFKAFPPQTRAAMRCRLLEEVDAVSANWDCVKSSATTIFLPSPLSTEEYQRRAIL